MSENEASKVNKVNVPLLRKAVEWAEAEAAKPELECRWEQRYFVSEPHDRARLLAAERVGSLEGATFSDWRKQVDALTAELAPQCGTCYCIAGYVAEQHAEVGPDGVHSKIAQSMLGLSGREADRLFDANNSIEDVRRIAEDLAGERL